MLKDAKWTIAYVYCKDLHMYLLPQRHTAQGLCSVAPIISDFE